MNEASGSLYIHGSDPKEQHRLSILNSFMNAPSLREINVKPAERILDVGCGLAQLTRAMAIAAGHGGFTLGIERDEKQLNEARRQAIQAGHENLIELRQGDAYNLPLTQGEWGTFDLAHARFVLEHVPDPLRVVQAMVRAVNLGGRIVLEDDDHDVMRMEPEPPHFREFLAAYMKTYERLGNDPRVGSKLVSLLHEAGAKPKRNTWIFFGTCAGQENFDAAVTNFQGIVSFSRPEMIGADLISTAAFDAMEREFKEWSHHPAAALWYAICLAEGIRTANP